MSLVEGLRSLASKLRPNKLEAPWAEALIDPDGIMRQSQYYSGQMLYPIGYDPKEASRQQVLYSCMQRLAQTPVALYEFDIDDNGCLSPHPWDDMGMVSVWFDLSEANRGRLKIVISDSVPTHFKEEILPRLIEEARKVGEKTYGWRDVEVEVN